METLHLPRHSLADDTLAGRKFAVRIALEALKFSALGDLASVDMTLHRDTETIEIRLGSRWNFRCRLSHYLIGH